MFKLLFFFGIIFLLSGCYYVDRLSFEHPHYNEIHNFYNNNEFDESILPYFYNGKVLFIRLSSVSAYNSSLFYLKNDIINIKIEVRIFSKEKLENIRIKFLEIIFGDFIIRLNNVELNGLFHAYINPNIPYVDNYIELNKEIEINDLKKSIKNINGINNISVKINLDYYEKGEITNWNNITNFEFNIKREEYNPKNLWK
jgi:hypothetical protein